MSISPELGQSPYTQYSGNSQIAGLNKKTPIISKLIGDVQIHAYLTGDLNVYDCWFEHIQWEWMGGNYSRFTLNTKWRAPPTRPQPVSWGHLSSDLHPAVLEAESLKAAESGRHGGRDDVRVTTNSIATIVLSHCADTIHFCKYYT